MAINTFELTQLISEFRKLTQAESITPEMLGNILQQITNVLATCAANDDMASETKSLLSQIKAEITARTNADSQLNSAINTEATARADQDKILLDKIKEQISKGKKNYGYLKINSLTVGSSADDVASALIPESENKRTMPNVGDILVDWNGVTRVPVVRQTVQTGGEKPIYSFSFRTADNTATKTVKIQGYLYEPQTVVSVETVKDVTQQMIQARVSGYQGEHLTILSPNMLPTDEVRVYRKLRTTRNVNPKDPNYNSTDYVNCRRQVKRWCEVKWINEYLTPIGEDGGMQTMKPVHIKTVRHYKSGIDQYYEVLFNVEGTQEDLSAKAYFDKYYVCKGPKGPSHTMNIRNGKYQRYISADPGEKKSTSVTWGIQVLRNGMPVTEIMPFKFTAYLTPDKEDSVTALTVI